MKESRKSSKKLIERQNKAWVKNRSREIELIK